MTAVVRRRQRRQRQSFIGRGKDDCLTGRLSRFVSICLVSIHVLSSVISWHEDAVVPSVSASSNHDDQSRRRQRRQDQEEQDSTPLSSSTSSESFYQRYKVYPPYCGDPTEMQRRTIPDLDLSSLSGGQHGIETRLEHISVVIRHGARTPTNSGRACWSGYWDIPQGVWDCDLKTVMLATEPNPKTMTDAKDIQDDQSHGTFLVEKVYDAFVEVDGSTSNVNKNLATFSPYKNNLNGTCQLGQLIKQGYDQQITNGQILRNRYIHDGTRVTDPRLMLFDTSADATVSDGYPFSSRNLRYRSDDDQRTVASGQVLLQSLFGPELQDYVTKHDNPSRPIVDHHTADMSLDILSSRRPGNEVCKRILERIEQKAQESDEYQSFSQSEESILMEQLIDEELSSSKGFGQDCMMTAICTDRPIPDVIDDYTGENSTSFGNVEYDENDADIYSKKYGRNRFVRLRDYLIQKQTMIHKFNNSEYAKRDMSAFWMEILDYIGPVIDDNNQDHVRMALYSGHDSTIIPLMASLGAKMWNNTNFPYYASMMIIEIHQVTIDDTTASLFPSGYAFRLIYNGQVMTWLVDSDDDGSSNICPQFSQICDVSLLIDRVKSFATRSNKGCGKDDHDSSDDGIGVWTVENLKRHGEELLTTTEQSAFKHDDLFLALSVLSSFAIGFCLACCSICAFSRQPKEKQRRESELVVNSGEDEEPDVVID